MFASQAALVIANARRHRDEIRARADLESLIDTSPVGVVVFDAKTGIPVSINRETRRILGDLHTPGIEVEQLLDDLKVRRADGREVSLADFPLAKVLSTAQTVRAEEIVLEVPDGRSVTTLVNATPIRSKDDGKVESVVVTLQDLGPLEEQERLRAEFLGMVSHELRMPLTSIRGSASAMLDASSDLGPCRDTPVPPHHHRPGRQHARTDRGPAGRGPHRDRHAADQPRACRGRSLGGPGQEHLL